MSAAWDIRDLKDLLRADGQAVVIRRPAHPTPFDVTVRGFVRATGATDILDGVAMAGDQTVVIAGDSLGTWPDGAADLPRRSDVVVIQGREASVQHVRPFRVGDTLVRVELIVRGQVR